MSMQHKELNKLTGIVIRPVEKKDNAALSILIKTVLTEFGANRAGFAFTDPETDAMYEAYHRAGHEYFVAERSNELIGGIGFGALTGADGSICELRKMYLLKEARGLGLGDQMLCLAQEAASKDYALMYLETLASMSKAIALYQHHQFELLPGPLGNTGHYSCDTWMSKKLRA